VATLRFGGRALPGVLLGSFAVNAATSPPAAAPGTALAIALAIAGGAALQAGVGGAAIRRLLARPLVLESGRDIAAFLLLGGPLAAVCNATVGVATLDLAGVLRWSEAAFIWWTWWVGDAIGATVFAPILLALGGTPRAAWRPRRLSVALPLAVGFAVVTLLFVRTSQWERDHLDGELTRRALVLDRALARSIDRYAEPISALAAVYRASPEVSATEFDDFISPLLARRPAIATLGWAIRVEDADRDAYEQERRRELGRAFTIWERTARGEPTPAPRRPSYLVLHRLGPRASTQAALGFDVTSEPLRRDTLARAMASYAPAASPPVTLAQDTGPAAAVVVLSVVHRGTDMVGVAMAAIRYRALVDDALAGLDRTGLAVQIVDEGVRGAPARHVVHADPRAGSAAPVAVSRLAIGGRTWRIAIAPASADPPRTWQSWLVMAGGLSLLAVLGGVLLLVTARASRTAASERDQQFLLAVGDAIRACRRDDEVFATAAARLGTFLAVNQCFFAEVALEDDHFTVRAGFHPDGAIAGRHRLSAFSQPTQTALRAGRTVAVDDAASDPRTAAHYPQAYAPHGFRALLGVPLLVEGRWSATLWAIGGGPRAWQPREIALVQAVAERAWSWVDHLRLTGDLERRVRERTQALEATLRDKDVLLREVHHRVKNNLQVISSLLYMQAQKSAETRVRDTLAESRARVQSIALVHDQLYRGASDASSIDLGHYLDELVRSLARAQQTPRVRIVIETSALRLPLDQAVSCGLAVNELISNALKHGFPGERAGTVTIAARATDDGHAEVSVHDDGVGLPADFDPRARARTGLGMVVVGTLATQLGGTLTVDRDPGTRFTIRFPLEPAAPRHLRTEPPA
jgi:two-component sensor histidine kinase/CHASE1-domain containing sensor protein